MDQTIQLGPEVAARLSSPPSNTLQGHSLELRIQKRNAGTEKLKTERLLAGLAKALQSSADVMHMFPPWNFSKGMQASTR